MKLFPVNIVTLEFVHKDLLVYKKMESGDLLIILVGKSFLVSTIKLKFLMLSDILLKVLLE